VISFFGRAELKAEILSQMERHTKDARLADVEVNGALLRLYEWPGPVDYARCEALLGVPQDLMRLGVALTEGFPDGERSIREAVRSRRRFLEALPVGADLRGVAAAYLASILLDEDIGPVHLAPEPPFVDAAILVAEALSTPAAHGVIRDAESTAADLFAAASADRVRALVERRGAMARLEARVTSAQVLLGAARFARGDIRSVIDVVVALERSRHDDVFIERFFALLSTRSP
jgi:hypothetical protein